MTTTALKLRYYGDPCLRRKAAPVKQVGPAERMLIREMTAAMYTFDGSGLAAPQVGLDLRIFVADEGEGPYAVIDPEILAKGDEETVMEEGCLSLPKIRINVKRPEVVRIRYLTETNRFVEKEISGIRAKIFQHEMDHLDGRMIIDHATRAEREKYRDQLARLEALSRKNKLPGKKA
jgi:peptide deformylase